MNGRDLERIMVSMGAGQSAVDTVTRKLRAAKRLPTGGRGLHAPPIDAYGAAVVIATIAASNPALDADERALCLERMQTHISAEQDPVGFLDALATILGSVSVAGTVREVRVGSNINLAEIPFTDGSSQRFTSGRIDSLGLAMFRKEGILTGELLKYVAKVLAGELPPPKEHVFADGPLP